MDDVKTYSLEQVRTAAAFAYRNSVSGADDAYVARKTKLFCKRVQRFDNREDGRATLDAVHEIVHAALDGNCSSAFYRKLSDLDSR